MDEAKTDTQKPIQAAGALLWRPVNGSYEIAIIHRRRYDDWTLPKGKLQEGETHLQAALREVKEETGYTAQVLSFAAAISYDTGKGIKVVRLWHMIAQGKPSKQLDSEVAEVVWLTVEAAHDKLQYPLEKALLEMWKSPEGADAMKTVQIKTPGAFRRFLNWLDVSSSKRRLERELSKSLIEISTLIGKDALREAGSLWAKNSRQLLDQAEQHRLYGRIDTAWHSLKTARRWALYGLYHQDITVFNSQALSIFREGTAKKIDSAWRRNTIKDLLTQDGKKFEPISTANDIGKAFIAQLILDDYQDNIYEKSYILQRRLIFLDVAAGIAIAGWIALAPRLHEMAALPEKMPVRLLWLAIVVAGFIGAVTSGFTRSLVSSGSKARIPEQMAEIYISLARLFVGAVSAIGITLILLSGLLNLERVLSLGVIFAVAFISGFTEKLLQNAIEKTVSKAEKTGPEAEEQAENYVNQPIEQAGQAPHAIEKTVSKPEKTEPK